MQLTVEQLTDNYEKFLQIIDDYITGERRDQLRQLYLEHQERVMLMPASSKEHHHSAYPGGYVTHVINVVNTALKMTDLWKAQGADIDFTIEELVFAAINHDLGKIGDEDNEMYIPQDSDWHRKNQGALYKMNPLPDFMLIPDRSLFLLQQRGIKVSLKEWFGIKLHDGLYDEANKPYYIAYDKNARLRSNLPYILHQADSLAAKLEYDQWLSGNKKPKIKQVAQTDDHHKAELMNVFDQLFKKD